MSMMKFALVIYSQRNSACMGKYGVCRLVERFVLRLCCCPLVSLQFVFFCKHGLCVFVCVCVP